VDTRSRFNFLTQSVASVIATEIQPSFLLASFLCAQPDLREVKVNGNSPLVVHKPCAEHVEFAASFRHAGRRAAAIRVSKAGCNIALRGADENYLTEISKQNPEKATSTDKVRH
jgi:hypothetical protein